MFEEQEHAKFGEHDIVAQSASHLVQGRVYSLLVDGEEVGKTTNVLKRPGRFVVRANIALGGVERVVEAKVRQGLLSTSMTLHVDDSALELAARTDDDQRKRNKHRIIIAAILVLAVTVVVAAAPALLPTRRGPLAEELEPFSTRGSRRGTDRCNSLVTRGGCEPVAVAGVHDEEVSFASSHPERGLTSLAGTLTLPEGPSGPHPALIVIGGSGPNPRNPAMQGGLIVKHDAFPLYGALAEHFANLGIAVLRYDKRTCRKCYAGYTPDLKEFRFEFFEDDVRDAITFLRAREDIDAHALILLGHSQGGGAAVRLAGEDEGVAATIMLAGSTRAFANGLPGQLRRLANIRTNQFDWIGAMLLRAQADDFETCLREAKPTPLEPKRCLQGTTYQAFHEETERAHTTRSMFSSLGAPVFAIHGQYDRNIDPAVIVELAEDAINLDAEVHVVEGIGHSFVHRDDTSEPRLAPAVATLLTDFVATVPRRAAAKN